MTTWDNETDSGSSQLWRQYATAPDGFDGVDFVPIFSTNAPGFRWSKQTRLTIKLQPVSTITATGFPGERRP